MLFRSACVGEWVTPLLGEAETSDRNLAAIYDKMTPSYMLAHQALRPVWRAMASVQAN